MSLVSDISGEDPGFLLGDCTPLKNSVTNFSSAYEEEGF